MSLQGSDYHPLPPPKIGGGFCTCAPPPILGGGRGGNHFLADCGASSSLHSDAATGLSNVYPENVRPRCSPKRICTSR